MKKILFLTICLFLLLFSCFGRTVVKYTVTGTASSASITYANKDEGTEQIADTAVPWSYSFDGITGNFVYISAQNQGESGSVTVTIYINGSVYKTATSSGEYVIAYASGTI
jgi:hypothetical protein